MTDRPRTFELWLCPECENGMLCEPWGTGFAGPGASYKCYRRMEHPHDVYEMVRVRVVEADPVIAALDGLEAHWRTDKDCVPCRETRRMVRELRGAICDD